MSEVLEGTVQLSFTPENLCHTFGIPEFMTPNFAIILPRLQRLHSGNICVNQRNQRANFLSVKIRVIYPRHPCAISLGNSLSYLRHSGVY